MPEDFSSAVFNGEISAQPSSSFTMDRSSVRWCLRELEVGKMVERLRGVWHRLEAGSLCNASQPESLLSHFERPAGSGTYFLQTHLLRSTFCIEEDMSWSVLTQESCLKIQTPIQTHIQTCADPRQGSVYLRRYKCFLKLARISFCVLLP